MFDQTYRNKAGKSFTEGDGFKITEFFDYYNTLTDDEWDNVIKTAAKNGYDISNIKHYTRVYGMDGGRPMDFEEVREKLLEMHGCGPFMCSAGGNHIRRLYDALGVPVPDYWKDRLQA